MDRTAAYKVLINTHSSDRNALILFADGALLGVLVELSEECHGAERGKWIIEADFGNIDERSPVTFPTASDAANWLGSRVAAGRFALDGNVPMLS